MSRRRRLAAALVPALAAITLGVGPAAADPAPGVPLPPPVDSDRLPADATPTALRGLRQTKECARPARPEPDTLPALLWGQRAMRLPELHRVTRGAAIRVAVIDSGVARHPLLAGRLIAGGDYVAGGNGLADCEGHGTAVAGIVAAATDPASGFAGVAPQAEVIAIRQTSASYVASGPDSAWVTAGDTTTLARAVVRAVELGARVINISEVACVPAGRAAATGAVLQAALHHAAERDVVVVVAAGNRGSGGPGDCPAESGTSTLVLPAWYDEEVLAVASLAPDGSASQFGIRAPWVDVAAPGERVASLSPVGGRLTDRVSNPDADVPMQGTSFAAPAVAGLAALIRARYPRLTARQVVDRITATADRREAGRSVATGWGAVDAEEALTRAPAVLEPPDAAIVPRPAGTGLLPIAAAAPERAPGPTAVWAGVLALVAAGAAAGLAVLRSRGHNDPRP